jgi:DHA2 family multidrug resistance protein
VHLSLISFAFLALFCLIELNHAQPLIDVRLLGRRNFAFINILNLSVGLVLAYAYVLPLYLGQVQGYNAVQIGCVLIWGAVVNPFVPKLVELVEARLVLAIGLGIFVISCFMNATLTYNNAGNQFVLSQVVRAIGQPVMVVAVSYIATSGIQKEQAESASSIFNIIRTVAATLGSSILGTLLTHREQFHSSRLVETVSMYNEQTQHRIQQLNQFFTTKLGDPNITQSQAEKVLGQSVHRQASIMAYSDCFYFIGMGLVLSGLIILVLRKSRKPTETVN